MTHDQDASELSGAAFKHIEPRLAAIEMKVLFALGKRGPFGATDHELVAELGIIKDTVAPRRYDLSRREPPLVVKKLDSRGYPVTRKTPSGRPAQVWVVNDPKQRLKAKRVANKIRGGFALFQIDEHGQYIFKNNVYPTQYHSAKAQADAWVNSVPKGES